MRVIQKSAFQVAFLDTHNKADEIVFSLNALMEATYRIVEIGKVKFSLGMTYWEIQADCSIAQMTLENFKRGDGDYLRIGPVLASETAVRYHAMKMTSCQANLFRMLDSILEEYRPKGTVIMGRLKPLRRSIESKPEASSKVLKLEG